MKLNYTLKGSIEVDPKNYDISLEEWSALSTQDKLKMIKDIEVNDCGMGNMLDEAKLDSCELVD
jgi:hypothetical protein